MREIAREREGDREREFVIETESRKLLTSKEI